MKSTEKIIATFFEVCTVQKNATATVRVLQLYCCNLYFHQLVVGGSGSAAAVLLQSLPPAAVSEAAAVLQLYCCNLYLQQ